MTLSTEAEKFGMQSAISLDRKSNVWDSRDH